MNGHDMTTVTVQGYQPTQEDLESYWQNGYWISPKLLKDDQIIRLRDAVERVCAGKIDGHGAHFNGPYEPNNKPGLLKRVINAWWINEEIRIMVLDPLIGCIVATLMKVPAVRLFSDQVLIKPGVGSTSISQASNVGWHQDAAYWCISSNRTNMVTAWIALQDTDLNNGGMRTLMGSHKWGFIEDSNMFYDPNLDDQRASFESKGLGPWIDEPCVLKAGQVSFHHSLCFHGSEINRTDQPRISVIGHYMPDGTTFPALGKPQTFLHLLGPDPQPDMLLIGPNFPQVWPPQEKEVD